MSTTKKRLTPSIEDYLETIYLLDTEKKGVRSIDVASQLMVSKPSVNKAVNNLIEARLVRQEKYAPIFLTELGQKKAKEVLNRHVTIKEFLISVLKVSEKTAEQEACLIEHSMSNETVAKMRVFLDEQKVLIK